MINPIQSDQEDAEKMPILLRLVTIAYDYIHDHLFYPGCRVYLTRAVDIMLDYFNKRKNQLGFTGRQSFSRLNDVLDRQTPLIEKFDLLEGHLLMVIKRRVREHLEFHLNEFNINEIIIGFYYRTLVSCIYE